MNLNELNQKFLDIEYKERLFDMTLDGVPIWQHMRYYVYRDLCQTILGIPKFDETDRLCKIKRKSPAYILKQKLNRNVMYDKKENPFLFQKRDALVLLYPSRIRQKGYDVEMYVDDYIEQFDISYYALEWGFTETDKRAKRPQTKHLRYVTEELIISIFTSRAGCNYKKLNLMFWQRFIMPFEKGLGVILSMEDRRFILKRLYVNMDRRDSYLRYYKFILSQIQPKLVFYYNYTEYTSRFLVECANQMGIRTVEIQHGILYPMITYINIEMCRPDAVPYAYFAYGRVAEKQNIKLCRVFSVGRPKFEAMAHNCIEYHLKTSKVKVLLISSCECEFFQLVKTWMKEAKNSFELSFKLHPLEYQDWEQRYPELLEMPYVNVISDWRHDIYYYIQKADIIIGQYSTTLFEAIAFKKKIIVFSSDQKELPEAVEKAVVDGVFFRADNLQELKAQIDSPMLVDKHPCMDYYWEPDSKRKVYEAVKRLMGEGGQWHNDSGKRYTGSRRTNL